MKITKNQRIETLERLGLNKPRLKRLDQSVFDGQDDEWQWAALDSNGEACLFGDKPKAFSCTFMPGNLGCISVGKGYDASDWQNSLIERDDIAKKLAEVDLSSELTGSDYYYSKLVTERLETGQKLIMCFVSNISESDAMQERRVGVIASVDTEFNDTDSYGWQYAVPINNQGEPLTASEVGL